METFSGIAREVRANGAAPKNANTDHSIRSFEIAGHHVKLAPARGNAQRCPIHDGDEVVVMGHVKNDQVTARAYRNVSLGCTARATCRQDMMQGALSLAFCVALLAFGWTLEDHMPLVKWTGRVVFFAMGTLCGLLAELFFRSAVETFRAELALMRAALEAVRGIAGDVERDDTREGRVQMPRTRLKLGGRSVELVGFDTAAICDGDEVVVVGEQRGGVLAGTAFRNFSRSRAGAMTGLGNLRGPAFMLAIVTFCLAFSWVSEAPGWRLGDWMRAVIWLSIGAFVAYDAVEPMYQWMLRREAYRRIKRTDEATNV